MHFRLSISATAIWRESARARQRTLDEHTGEHRARQMLDYFEEALAARHGKLAALPRQQPHSLETPYQRGSFEEAVS